MREAEDDRDFDSSALGTKEYWDQAYEREVKSFKELGDVGEIWFGEDKQERLVDWLDDNEEVKKDDRIIDLGCGNGMMLVELHKRGFTELTGVDYSEGAISLAKSVAEAEDVEGISYMVADLISDKAAEQCSCLSVKYKVCLDKGTYDAISLMPGESQGPRKGYLTTVKSLMGPDSLFLLTSCNWTKDELMKFWGSDFGLHKEIRFPTFQFGGKQGSTVTSLILQLKS